MASGTLAGRFLGTLSAPAIAASSRPLARRGLAAAASPKAPVLRRRRPKPPKKKERSELAGTQLVSAYVMASTHRPVELAQLLREKFGPAAVRYMGDGDEAAGGAGGGDDRANVVHLTAPALGLNSPHGTPPASVFFFTSGNSDDFPDSPHRRCISVWWGADEEFELDLHSLLLQQTPKRDQLASLSLKPELYPMRGGEASAMAADEIVLRAAAEADARLLDQLAFSYALQRHMKLKSVEDEVDRVIYAVMRATRTEHGEFRWSELLPRRAQALLGGSNVITSLQFRLMLLGEFNFDKAVVETPDWLWDQPEREAMYDGLVDECEVEERIETLKSRLEYAKDTLQTLKDDRQQQHNFFIEVAICALLAYEVATAATPSNEALRGALEVALSYVPGR